ncbi:MAG: hypothetical protein HRT91_01240 [Piscirickettsiaceae bacterium]|nr:hypothetical protein [Piscirickettsiaceae bacterium]
MNWNETAADQVYDKAQFHLGNIYETGRGMVEAYKEEGLNFWEGDCILFEIYNRE